MSKPLVSICLPTFNGAEFLEETLDSIGNQIYKNFELVVSDNCSTDNTVEIIKEFIAGKDFAFSIHHRERYGIGDNWNNCIKNANGDYIKFLFQDDILYPDCISKMVNCFLENNSIALVASKRKIIYHNSENWKTEWVSKYQDLQDSISHNMNNDLIFDKKLFKHPNFLEDPFNKIGEPTAIMFSRSLVEKIGYFRTDLEIILDIEFYYRTLANFKILVLNEELVGFRLHSDQASRKNKESLMRDFEIFQNLLLKHYFFLLRTKDKIKLLNYFLKGNILKKFKGLKFL